MAEDKKRKEIKPDEFIGRVIPDPSNPRVLKLVGYFLGDSTNADFWRLYLSPDLDHYLEFRKADTLDAERFNTGRLVVWLKADAKVFETFTKPVPADFLRGGIQSSFLRVARDAIAGGPKYAMAGACSLGDCTPPCESHVNTCPQMPACQTIGYTCGC